MSRIASNKEELLSAIDTIFPKLMADYRSISASKSRVLGVQGNVKGSVVSVCDTLAYLLGWGNLVLKWYHLKQQAQPVDFPERGFKWNQLGLLAEHFHQTYADWEYEDLLAELEVCVTDIRALILNSNNHELYEVPWYEKWTLGRMIQLNTASPMMSTRTKIRRFKRQYC
ncbi:ClbS/DfsB family four-helix bundle protein [Pseudoalteromonas luteoviolacea]|uniref:ClbS/DfsB family four-helix bundle protein n=1 Tax=Pseudoalteromonas luteoviolacea TaxID=43657 RepID=UPI001F312988|nr:ClbS/DfsB family four-helix bundle protein [Pseudoalteromonas luteoviolacea]MCF6441828.1 ClbS/DfsB family four-helix bundle protein [Pseudoalteromonas luteoviolacea]